MQNKIKNLLKPENSYKVQGSLWISCNDERFFGPGRIELLQNIEKTGSISKAAKEMKMSYKKAWGMISELNMQAKNPLVISKTGGEEGGGSTISDEAKELIGYYELLKIRFLEFLNKETNQIKHEIQ